MNTIHDRETFLLAISSKNILKLREADEFLSRLIKVRSNDRREEVVQGLNFMRQSLLSQMLIYQADLPEGDLTEEDSLFLERKIKEIREYFY